MFRKNRPRARIVKRMFNNNKNVCYVIQEPHFLFRWWWVDAWINSSCGASFNDTYSTIEEAREAVNAKLNSVPTSDEVVQIFT